ncbi:MAG: GGDEF domain-containing protein [Gammaproteobacteria bacterium]
MNLAAREAAVLAREQAADRREAALQAIDAYRLLTETRLREANEHLVVATVQANADTEAAVHAAAQMAIKAEHDFLTGLPNRALLTDRLEQAIVLAARHRKKVALMFLDLDNFKEINDSLGHLVGDGVLQSVAKRLQAGLRKSDTVSRQGGDEFLVLLTEVESVHDTALIAEKLITAVAAPHSVAGYLLDVTLSIGISLYPENGGDVEMVLTSADTAMYHAKRSGRNNYRLFTPDMSAGRPVPPRR